MSHEKGIEAAAQAFVTACRDYTEWSGSKYSNARSIIAAYLAEAQPTREGKPDRCDCGKSMEACAATEDCSGQSMPATSEGEERVARRVIWELIMAAGGEVRVPNAIALQSSPTSRIEKYDDNKADCVVWRIKP